MSNGKWASPKYHRDQLTLFSPSVDDMVPKGHRVRRFEEIIDQVDWSDWEDEYNGSRGQPPIHPKFMAGAILYGLTERLRSSRELEKATKMRLDFVWLLHGRSIDHSTFAGFRTRFKASLEKLFPQLALIALKGDLELELAVDGTRIRANSSRTGALSAKGIEKRAEQIATELTKALEEMETLDAFDESMDGSPEELQKRIDALQTHQAKLTQALKEARERDEARAKHNSKKKSRPVRIPLSDSDSHILPNKEGGYAPNYTPTVAVDTSSGVIVSAEVPEGGDEASVVSAAIAVAEELTGDSPKNILFDGAFATGPNLEELSQNDISAYAPSHTMVEGNPALRQDLSQPVPAEKWDSLPTQAKNGTTLTREAFVFDKERDCYWCPMGQMLPKLRKQTRKKGERTIVTYEYRCLNCESCPLATRCLSKKARNRTISRDEFEQYREQLRERMNDDTAKEVYRRRAPVAEGTFAHIKHNMGIRQFLHRGIEKVRTEWLWTCAAFNVSKILKMAMGADPSANLIGNSTYNSNETALKAYLKQLGGFIGTSVIRMLSYFGGEGLRLNRQPLKVELRRQRYQASKIGRGVVEVVTTLLPFGVQLSFGRRSAHTSEAKNNKGIALLIAMPLINLQRKTSSPMPCRRNRGQFRSSSCT